MNLWSSLSAFALAVSIAGSSASASTVTVVVREVADQKTALDIAKLERSIVRIITLQQKQKVLNLSKAMKACKTPDCFRDRLGVLGTQTWLLIEFELVRKGIFGLGSRCIVSIEERDQNGLPTSKRNESSSSCHFDSLVEEAEELLRSRFESSDKHDEQKPVISSSPRKEPANSPSQKKFKACGNTRKEALELLSQSISSKISDSFTSKETAKNQEENIEISKEVSIQSNVHLLDVEWSKEEDKVCASQRYAELLNATLARLERVSECEKQLPKGPQQRERVVSACLSDIRFVSEIYPLFWSDMSDSYREIAKSLEAQSARLEELGGKIFFQSVRVDVKTEDGTLFIEQVEQPMATQIFVPVGQTLVEIKSGQRCDFSRKVNIKENEQVVVRPDLTEVSFPQVTFEVGQKGARLTVDGEIRSPNQVLTFARCEGTLPYKLVLRDGESKTGQIELSPGLNKVVSLRVLTQEERRKLTRLANSFERSGLLTGRYKLAYPFSEKLDEKSVINQFDVNYTVGRGAFRYGGGASYGFADNKIHLFEAYGVLGAQLTDFGKQPLNIAGALAVIPYLSVDLGVGLHGYDTNVSKRRSDFGSFLDSYIIARGHAGTRIAFNEELSFEVDFSHNLTMERELGLNLGVSVRLK